MAKLLAIEWDAREVRLAVARTRGKDVIVDDAFAVDLAPSEPGQMLADVNVGERIAAALTERGIGRIEALVAVGRASIELRRLDLPPAPPEELPELVRFQALRQFTTISDQWPLDFVPLHTEAKDRQSVLAAAISPEMVEQIRETCRTGDLTPKRLVLRPFAAAALLCRSDRGSRQPPRLMVDILTDEADLTVLVDEQVVLMRTVRLPAADISVNVSDKMVAAVQSKSLVGEIRRTVAAAHNQIGGQRIEKIIVCGDGSDQATLKELIEKDLSFAVELFDPFEQLRLGGALSGQRPKHGGRFAPLLGMLLDEAAGAAHALDFLHPRKKPEPPSRRRRNVLIGAALAAAALAAAFLVWVQLTSLDDQIQDLAAQATALKKQVEAAEQNRLDLTQTKEFLESDITWIDELYDLCEAIPPSDDLLITQLTLATRASGGGQIVIDGYTRTANQIEQVQRALLEDGRQVISRGFSEDLRRDDYRWRFNESVLIPPRRDSDLRTNGGGDSEGAGQPTTQTSAAGAIGGSGEGRRSQ